MCSIAQDYGVLKAHGGGHLNIDILVGGQNAMLLPERVLLNRSECRIYFIKI